VKEMLTQVLRLGGVPFRARSAERDRQTDLANVALIGRAIDEALKVSLAERNGLGRRVADALSRAAITVGNDVDEYVTRETEDTSRLNDLDAEIQSGQDRLKQLDYNIAQFEALKIDLANRFPKLSEAIR
jgi:predicted nuclease with TOPRIM domain